MAKYKKPVEEEKKDELKLKAWDIYSDDEKEEKKTEEKLPE